MTEEMDTLRLAATTGDARADLVLRGVVHTFEAAFPERVRGYYLHGSHAEGGGLPTSDLDLYILFRQHFRGAAERERAEQLRDACAARSAIELDIELGDETALGEGLDPTFKLGSTLIYGEDVRASYPLLPLDEWALDRLHSSYWRIITLFGRPLPVVTPLDFPDPADEFYGYTRRLTRLPGGGAAPGTRDLIRSVGWAATALLALRAGVYVARKRDCATLYREHIGDAWAELLEQLDTRCRGAWHYLIPTDGAERAELRDICARTLGFENHFLAVYHDYLLAELRGAAGPHRQQARWVLEQLPWRVELLAEALQASADG
ncbi:MAG TPA: nucleotidyltransferase domain-containing protein [Ktedonobacterales bacterium]|jgi:hypothetical protein